VIFLNGGSSSGKSTIGRMLQSVLDGTWLLLGIDVLIWTLPVELTASPEGLIIDQGVIHRGPAFLAAYDGFRHAVGALCRSGVDVIVDDVLLDGGKDQLGWAESLGEFETCWVAVRCDPVVAASREAERGDRPTGGALAQASSVHQDVRYDIEVDTSDSSVASVVQAVTAEVSRRWSVGSAQPSSDLPRLPVRSAWSRDGTRSLAPWER
jgi:chloramphenicol 3-O phosphotransferase